MEVNNSSTLGEIVQALNGTWERSLDDGWTVLENGKLKIYKKLTTGNGETGSITLPPKFMSQREDITPYFRFTKNGIKGGIITLQDNALELNNTTTNELVVILQF